MAAASGPLSTLQDFETFVDYLRVYPQKNLSHTCPVQDVPGGKKVRMTWWLHAAGSQPRRRNMELFFLLLEHGLEFEEGCVLLRPTQDPEVKLVGEGLLLRSNERGLWLEKHS